MEGTNLRGGGEVVDFDGVVVAARDGGGSSDGDGLDGREMGGEGEEWGKGEGMGVFPGFELVAPDEALVGSRDQTHLCLTKPYSTEMQQGKGFNSLFNTQRGHSWKQKYS